MLKTFKSPDYNFMFNMKTGFFARWGATQKDDPEYSPFGPEILDIEISTVCSQGCKFCYKSNTPLRGRNMSFEAFSKMFEAFPKHLTQIAFGIGDIDGNPDLWRIMEHCRHNDVIPNVTINGNKMTPELYDRLVNVCGAVAVSLYDKDTCYNAVQELHNRGMKQVNIHALLSQETYDTCHEVLQDRQTDPRLAGLNAVVFLWLKPKGDRNTFTQLDSMQKFQRLIETAIATGGSFGFDSCTASNFLKAVEGTPMFDQYKIMCEPCESTLFSYYINVDGVGFPCSFSEGNLVRSAGSTGLASSFCGVDVMGCQDFISDVWNAEESKRFRGNVMANKDHNGCRMCPIFNLKVR